MAPPHIVVIDDDLSIRRLLRSSLRERGYQVSVVATGQEGLDLIAGDPAAVVILDLGLPDMEGLDVCRQLRSWTQVPILVLSARDQEMQKVQALDLGADDYLTKPFSTHELLARIRVALRHSERREAALAQLAFGDLRIDLARRRVTQAEQDVRLTPKEYDLLIALATQPGRVLTHSWLLQHIWGPGYEEHIQNLHVFISQLRRKIEPSPAKPQYILTEPGIGYRFTELEDH
ncbi:MAG TPA: response regulator transcription factor [Roseiflexaceae bacterium]|nr:response regulator transcription factor [Roseiflexaceae bacterium]